MSGPSTSRPRRHAGDRWRGTVVLAILAALAGAALLLLLVLHGAWDGEWHYPALGAAGR
jgi:hypothetical protein